MPRSGRRPGAGAPRGNLNAVKHGLESLQVKSVFRSGTIHEWKDVLAKIKEVKDRRLLADKGQRQAKDYFSNSRWMFGNIGQSYFEHIGLPIPSSNSVASSQQVYRSSRRRGMGRFQ